MAVMTQITQIYLERKKTILITVRKQSQPLAETPLQADTPREATPHPETATAVDGTHPTGMHSCFDLNMPRRQQKARSHYDGNSKLNKLKSFLFSVAITV